MHPDGAEQEVAQLEAQEHGAQEAVGQHDAAPEPELGLRQLLLRLRALLLTLLRLLDTHSWLKTATTCSDKVCWRMETSTKISEFDLITLINTKVGNVRVEDVDQHQDQDQDQQGARSA